jgi:hypothetical protein
MALMRVVRMPIHEIVHMLSRMHYGQVAAVGSMVMVRLAPVDLMQLGSVKHARAHEAAERIHSGARRSGSSSTTFRRR